MMLKTPESGFFFEYKKDRTKMLKKQEPPKPEPYYKKYIREQKEEETRLKKEAERRLKQEKLKEPEQVIIVVDEVSEIQQLNFSA